MSDINILREYIASEYTYSDESDPLDSVKISRVEKDGDGHELAEVGDYWLTDGVYGELVSIVGSEVVSKFYEGA